MLTTLALLSLTSDKTLRPLNGDQSIEIIYSVGDRSPRPYLSSEIKSESLRPTWDEVVLSDYFSGKELHEKITFQPKAKPEIQYNLRVAAGVLTMPEKVEQFIKNAVGYEIEVLIEARSTFATTFYPRSGEPVALSSDWKPLSKSSNYYSINFKDNKGVKETPYFSSGVTTIPLAFRITPGGSLEVRTTTKVTEKPLPEGL
ncbi:MAG: hypothetical protein MUC92_07930 [Fimbriimonadaceae bacterium]|jgi:hypothetical protein|nr:hypothetical protein [Fimbriimonadaceae bacterium]